MRQVTMIQETKTDKVIKFYHFLYAPLNNKITHKYMDRSNQIILKYQIIDSEDVLEDEVLVRTIYVEKRKIN